MKRAILVVGPEASGTRLVTRILIAAGCEGSDNHLQPLDWHPPDGATPIVWRRSLPHDNLWPDLPGMVRELRRDGYAVSVVATDRDDGPMVQAQARDHVKDEAVARQHIERARDIIGQLDNSAGAGLPVRRIRYEALVSYTQSIIDSLCRGFDLTTPTDIDIYDGNARYAEAPA